MNNIVVIAYPDEQQAAKVLIDLKRLIEAGGVGLDDAMAVSRNSEGLFRVEGAIDHARTGARNGFVLGALAGLVFFVPVAGALFGAAAGGLAGKLTDVGQLDDFITQVGDDLASGSSAVMMVVREEDLDLTLAELRPYGGKLNRTTLPKDAEAHIRRALGEPATEVA